MITADHWTEILQADLRETVTTMKRGGIDKMDAYSRLGGVLKKSGVWVRRVVGRDARAAVDLSDALTFLAWAHGLSPAAAYARLCERVEAKAGAIEANNDELRRKIDAALGGDHPGSVRLARGPTAEGPPSRGPGPAPAPALVPPLPRADRVGAPTAGELSDLPLWRAMTEE